jgi:hypothetical protein
LRVDGKLQPASGIRQFNLGAPKETGVHFEHPSDQNERRCSAGNRGSGGNAGDERWGDADGTADVR